MESGQDRDGKSLKDSHCFMFFKMDTNLLFAAATFRIMIIYSMNA